MDAIETVGIINQCGVQSPILSEGFGVLEYWSIGKQQQRLHTSYLDPLLHHSITPLLQVFHEAVHILIFT